MEFPRTPESGNLVNIPLLLFTPRSQSKSHKSQVTLLQAGWSPASVMWLSFLRAVWFLKWPQLADAAPLQGAPRRAESPSLRENLHHLCSEKEEPNQASVCSLPERAAVGEALQLPTGSPAGRMGAGMCWWHIQPVLRASLARWAGAGLPGAALSFVTEPSSSALSACPWVW